MIDVFIIVYKCFQHVKYDGVSLPIDRSLNLALDKKLIEFDYKNQTYNVTPEGIDFLLRVGGKIARIYDSLPS